MGPPRGVRLTKRKTNHGFVLWFTGLPCSGKTTLSGAVAGELLRKGLGVKVLDGDVLRAGISKDLRFSKAHRRLQVQRAASLAADFSRGGAVTIVSLVSPYRDHRKAARKKIKNFIEVHVRCPLSVCESRDVKGMYRLARQGKIRRFTGVSDPYEAPASPEVTVDTDRLDIQSCTDKVIFFLKNKKFLAVAAAVLFFISCAPAFAETLTWQDCVAESRKNHPDLVSAREKINQASADKSIAASAFFPQVNGTLDASTSKTGRKPSVKSYSYGVSGSQLLFDGFKTYDEVEQAAKNIDVNRYNYEVTSSNVRLRLRTAFIDLLKAQQFLKLTETIEARRKQNRDLINLRYNAGREHRGSLLTAEANLAQAQYDIEQAKRDIALAQRRLSKELGRPQSSPMEVSGSFEVAERAQMRPDFDNISVSTPFLRALVVQKEAAKWGVKSATASFFPQIYANGGLGRSSSLWPPRDNEVSAGATVSMPLFEGGSLVAGASKAQSVYRQAEADERSGRDGIVLTLEDTWTQLQDAMGSLEVEAKFLEANQTRSKIAEAEYSTGLVTFNDWTIIEDNLVNTEKAYLNAQAEAVLAEAGWLQAKGETLDEN